MIKLVSVKRERSIIVFLERKWLFRIDMPLYEK